MERFIIFPIQHQSIYDLYQKQKATFWVTEEVDFASDRKDFESFKPNEQKMLKHILAFFAASDTIVNENIISRFIVETPFPESRQFYGFQMAVETIHTETYGAAIQECIRDKTEQDQLFRAVLTMDGVRRKSQWAVDFMESTTKSFAERLIAYVIVEGIFFQNAFAVIFWIKEQYPGKLGGVVFSNDFISADERLHADHNVEQYKLLPTKDKLTQEQANAIFQSAYEMEKYFVESFLEEGILGMNRKLLIQHTEYMCDYWLSELGFQKLFHVKHPFPFMDKMALRPRTNFFERRNREYTRGKSDDSTIRSKSFEGQNMDF
jgi:ribonucleotide reductase beta subunit family protein with ferritin-like domain